MERNFNGGGLLPENLPRANCGSPPRRKLQNELASMPDDEGSFRLELRREAPTGKIQTIWGGDCGGSGGGGGKAGKIMR